MAAVTDQAMRVVTAIGHGVRFARTTEGWRGAGLTVSDAVIRRLVEARLIEKSAGGQLRLTAAGEARSMRRDHAQGLRVERIRMCADGGALRSETVNLAESPLGWLAARGHVTERQRVAGERLRADWTLAGLAPRVTMRWDMMPRVPGGGDDDPATAQIAAKRRFDAAIAHLGPGLGDIAWRVLCNGDGLSDAEAVMGWPKRSAKLVLGLALDRLTSFYSIA